MTVQTISRHAATRNDLREQGLWDFYDDLERAGYDVGTVDWPANDRHLLVTRRDGSAFKITGYGKDRLTVRFFDDARAYDDDAPSREDAELTEAQVLDVLDERRDLPRAA